MFLYLMIGFLKPEKQLDFWEKAPVYTTFPAAGVSGTGFAAALDGTYQILFQGDDVLRNGVAAALDALIGGLAGHFAHDNLKAMRE